MIATSSDSVCSSHTNLPLTERKGGDYFTQIAPPPRGYRCPEGERYVYTFFHGDTPVYVGCSGVTRPRDKLAMHLYKVRLLAANPEKKRNCGLAYYCRDHGVSDKDLDFRICEYGVQEGVSADREQFWMDTLKPVSNIRAASNPPVLPADHGKRSMAGRSK